MQNEEEVHWDKDEKQHTLKFGNYNAKDYAKYLEDVRGKILSEWRETNFEPSILKNHLYKVHNACISDWYQAAGIPIHDRTDIKLQEWTSCLEWMLPMFKSPLNDPEIKAIRQCLSSTEEIRANTAREIANEPQGANTATTQLKIRSYVSPTVITRIFEAMKKSGIISPDTEVRRIAGLFATRAEEISTFTKSYDKAKNDIDVKHTENRKVEFYQFVTIMAGQLNEPQTEKLIEFLEGRQNERSYQ